MKFASAVISVLALAFFALSLRGTTAVAVDSAVVVASNMTRARDLEINAATTTSKREKTKSSTRKKRNRRSIDTKDVRLLVRYANHYGKSYFTIFEGSSLIKELDLSLSDYNVASITISNKDMHVFQNNSVFEVVEIDHEVHAFGAAPPTTNTAATTDDKDSDNPNYSSRRQLTEQLDYGISMVQADQLTSGDTLIKICVVDTGYGEGHPDLPTAAHHNVRGWNDPLGAYGQWNLDVNGHGTHVAGILGAIGNNHQGVEGVNKDPHKFNLFISKGLSDSGTGSTSNVLAAVHQCAQNGANVINLSLGGTGRSVIAEGVYQDLYNQGILIFAAAGNSGSSETNYPASFPDVVSVSAVDSTKHKAWFSQYNPQVEISGPGVQILSTITSNNGTNFTYATMSGTSMATPYVAGVAALVWSHFPSCSNNQIRNVLVKTAALVHDVGSSSSSSSSSWDNPNCDTSYGHGIVQAKYAYDLLTSEGCQAGGPNPSPLSNGSFGGCEQGTHGNHNPTTSCEEGTTLFQLALLTDDYPEETSWDVVHVIESHNTTTTTTTTIKVLSGSGYTARRSHHHERHCLPNQNNSDSGIYVFTIQDSFNDGICCNFGNGLYEVTYGEAFHFRGDGNFTSEESFSFGGGEPTTMAPTPTPSITCHDDPQWTFSHKGRIKTCTWVADRPLRRCNHADAKDFCRWSCDSCEEE